MNKNGPIVIIEDDLEDQQILEAIFQRLSVQNEVVFMGDGSAALSYLEKVHVRPFLILSDINMPRMNGFELRSLVFQSTELRAKCVPYIFFTTSTSEKIIAQAYALSVQGFFIKPDSVSGLENMIVRILGYWKDCIAPKV